MDFKDILGKLDTLNEAEMTSRKVAGKAYGGSAQADDEDEDEEKKPSAPAVKRGRGRPRKAGGEADTSKRYGGASELQRYIVGSVPKKSKELEKLGKTKHKLSDKEPEKKKVKENLADYLRELDKILSEEIGQQVSIKPAKQDAQVISVDNKVVGTTTNPSLATALKAALSKGEVKLGDTKIQGSQLGEKIEPPITTDPSEKGKHSDKTVAELKKQLSSIKDKMAAYRERGEKVPAKMRGDFSELTFAIRAKQAHGGKWSSIKEADIYTDGMNSMGAGLGAGRSDSAFESKQGVEEGTETDKQGHAKFHTKTNKQIGPTHYGRGSDKKADSYTKADPRYHEVRPVKEQGVAEGKKPDFLDLDNDGNKKESMKKAADDKKKKKVDESMDSHLKAAHHRGKAHALAKEGYNCRYDEGSEEARMYHEGYKMGLDECYGIMPMRGVVVGEADMDEGMMGAALGGVAGAALGKTPSAAMTGARLGSTVQDMFANEDMDKDIVDDMASFGARHNEDEVEEGNAFTAALAKTPKGGKFTVGGKTFTDKTDYDAKVDEMMMAFEGWDKQLNELLTEGEKVEEGMSISVSKGQQGMPDSVSVTASDSEADKLMALVKQLGVFGSEASASDYGAPSDSEMVHQHGDVEVVDDHEGMLALMKKMSGGSEDYADETESEHSHDEQHASEETCESCGGMMEEGHSCHENKEMVDEVESEDQMEFENLEEANPPDSDEAETSADEEAEAQEDMAIAKYRNADKDVTVNEEQLDEWANDAGKDGTDTTFMRDIEFMTKTIAGGLNKEKSTGQTTIPVVAGQSSRMGVDGMNEGSLADLKKLSGI